MPTALNVPVKHPVLDCANNVASYPDFFALVFF